MVNYAKPWLQAVGTEEKNKIPSEVCLGSSIEIG